MALDQKGTEGGGVDGSEPSLPRVQPRPPLSPTRSPIQSIGISTLHLEPACDASKAPPNAPMGPHCARLAGDPLSGLKGTGVGDHARVSEHKKLSDRVGGIAGRSGAPQTAEACEIIGAPMQAANGRFSAWHGTA